MQLNTCAQTKMAWIKAYKRFNKDMTCRGFQYEVGKEYALPEGETPSLCENGFHACEDPLDCAKHYDPASSVIHEVELDATEEKQEGDSKRVGSRIRIGVELSIANLCKAHFEYVNARCNPVDGKVGGDHEAISVGEKAAASAGYRGSASAGNYGSASAGNYGSTSAGYRGSASAGESGSASAGNYGSASAGESGSASAGNYGSASAGYRGSASAGYRGSASAGYRGSASAGYRGSAVSRGSVSVGKNGSGLARGNGVKIRGGLGALLVIAEEKTDNYDITAWKAVLVDGKTVKADTWYQLNEKGELKEVIPHEDNASGN